MRSKTIACAGILCALLSIPSPAAAQSLRGPVDAPDALRLALHDTTLRITQGNPFDACGILLGMEARKTTLPGGAILRIDPLVVLVRGEFDAKGTFEIDIAKQLGSVKEPITVLAQAIALVHDSEFFVTSNVVSLGIATDDEVDPVITEPDVAPVPVEARRR